MLAKLILTILIHLPPKTIRQICDLLGPCQASVNLYNSLITLKQLK
jgi:hypothetical protein